MNMRNWEILAILGMIGVLLVLPVAVFAYQGYREAQEGPGMGARPPSAIVTPGDPVRGAELFGNDCSACHGKGGVGSAAAPDIRHMQAGAQFVYTWILDPAGVTPAATMPRIPLTEKQVADLTAYVMALKDGNAPVYTPPAQPQAPAPAAPAAGEKAAPSASGAGQSAPAASGGDAAKGKIIFTSKGCIGCHGPDGKGTAAAPSLVGVSGDAVKKQLRTPKDKMPAFGPSMVSDSDMEDLIAFLSTLK